MRRELRITIHVDDKDDRFCHPGCRYLAWQPGVRRCRFFGDRELKVDAHRDVRLADCVALEAPLP